MKIQKFVLTAVLACSVNGAMAQSDDDASTVDGPELCPNLQASTVFVPDKTGSRQKGSAKGLTESHRNAEKQGWDFSDLEVYIEDGDLQGFFVTYTRTHPCNNAKDADNPTDG